jgi:hypothetical protein
MLTLCNVCSIPDSLSWQRISIISPSQDVSYTQIDRETAKRSRHTHVLDDASLVLAQGNNAVKALLSTGHTSDLGQTSLLVPYVSAFQAR